jgi:hypothetical protein
MYALLVVLGAAIAALGVVIAVSGLPLQGRDFDGSIVTPGAVAVVGGLILIGLGLTVRVLSRIERALAARPLPRPAVPAEAHSVPTVSAPDMSAVTAEEPKAAPAARIALPPKPEARPQPAPAVSVATTPVLPEDAAIERLREQFPTLVRIENAPVVEEAEVSLLPKPPARADDAVVELNGKVAQGSANGAASARAEPRLDIPPRLAIRPERNRNFDAYWPKKPLAGRGAQAAAPAAVAPQPVEPALPAEPTQFQFREPEPEPPAAAPAPELPTPVSVLKSGVVDGMAYTLYSDGSIEAQLPQGTLRFGSIAELRTHIEQSA